MTAIAAIRFVVIAMPLAASFGQTTASKKDFEQADREMQRTAPAAFASLPANLARYLETRGYRIPQSASSPQPNNVIRGSFAHPGQIDWAVLCSIGRASSVLVFWNGSEIQPAEIARGDDRRFFAQGAGGQIRFLRTISAVDAASLRRATAQDVPTTWDHQAIEDGFVETGSVFFYFSDERWTRLLAK